MILVGGTLEKPGLSSYIVNAISHNSKNRNWKNLKIDFTFDSAVRMFHANIGSSEGGGEGRGSGSAYP